MNPWKKLARKLEATPEGRAAAVHHVSQSDPAAGERLAAKYAKRAQACPQCGGPGPFGAASGLCYTCSDAAADSLLRDYGIAPDPKDRLSYRPKRKAARRG